MQRILVVEDNLVQQRLYKVLCQRLAADCVLFDSVDAALAHLKSTEELPTLLLLDCLVKGTSSLPFVFDFKEIAAARGVTLPVVAITAHAFESDRAQCFAAGVDDYLAKPFTLDQFVETVQHWPSHPSAQTVA